MLSFSKKLTDWYATQRAWRTRGALFPLLAWLVSGGPASAQSFGNEWINYQQTYYKIPVTEPGLYRLTVGELQTAGFPVGSVNPQTLQLFHRGQEQAIRVAGEADGQLDPDDYLEFYGRGNDGAQDSLLYVPNNARPHPYYSLYSDTTAFFLTWRLDNFPGKRMDSFQQANLANLPAAPFHQQQNLQLFTGEFSQGQVYPRGSDAQVILSQWDTGEGWMSTSFNKGTNQDYPISLPRLVATPGEPIRLEILLVGRNNRRHNVEFFVGPTAASLRSLGAVQYDFFNVRRVAYELAASDLTATGEAVVRVRPVGFANDPHDRNSLAYLRVTFPQALAFTGPPQFFYLPANPADRTWLELPNPPAGLQLLDVTDPDNVRTIGGSVNSQTGRFGAMVNQMARAPRTLLATVGFKTTGGLARVGFRNFDPRQPTYLVVSNRALMRPAGNAPDAVRAYAAYRASPAGGRYDTLVVDTDLLYNQFNYGEFSPLAIRRFASYLLRNGKPQFLFLIGRSWYPFYTRNSVFRNAIDLVPTAGYPGSDALLTAGLNGGPANIAAIPTGRLNVPAALLKADGGVNYGESADFSRADPQDVINYLDKVREQEASPPNALWRKDLLHLSGGRSSFELRTFRGYVDGYRGLAQGNYLGGRVTTLSKQTDNTVEFINVVERINRGVGMITFFGHSALNIIDIDIGFVSNDLLGYRNKGKYPTILVNGCEAGNIFNGEPTLGSDWIRTRDRGAVLFMAHTHYGYSTPLNWYTETFYRTAFGDSTFIGKPLGVVKNEVSRRYLATYNSDFDVANAQQILLQGDPAVGIFPASLPDYAIDASRLFLQSYSAAPVSAVSDSFRLGVVVANYGRTDPRPLAMTVRRTLGNGTVVQYDTLLYPPVNYQDTLYVNIPNRAATGAGATTGLGGSNQFAVRLDPANALPELNEANNVATLDALLPTPGVLALFPREYSIVATQANGIPKVDLVAQRADGLAAALAGTTGPRNFAFELDTAATFDSPFRRTQTVAADFLATWNTPLLAPGTDSTVYYWRVRLADGPDNQWAESSFVYIAGSPEGWSQSRLPQLAKASATRLVRNQAANRWEFAPLTTSIRVETTGGATPGGIARTRLLLNNLPVLSAGACGGNALVGVAFRGNTAQPYSVNNALLCNNSIPFVTNFMYDYNLNVANSQLVAYLDAVPTGDYVLLFTIGNLNFSGWSTELRQKLTEIGASSAQVAQIQTGYPYAIVGRKGAPPGQALLEVMPDLAATAPVPPAQQPLTLSLTLIGRQTSGTITSSPVGPASAWGSVFRKVTSASPTGNWQLDVVGVSAQGTETTLQTAVPSDNFALAGVDARQYPYLRLRLRAQDTVATLPPQLNRWLVTYQGVPEGVLNPGLVSRTEYALGDRPEGDNFRVSFVFQNISGRDFADSLTFRYALRNRTGRPPVPRDIRLKRLAAGDTVRVTVPVSTLGQVGDNVLSAFFNPRLLPEEYYQNNALDIPFRVLRDRANPLLDVAFDGVRIMNGDIVSPSPLISVSLKDENRALVRRDTVGLELFLKRPGPNAAYEKISFSDPNVRYFPAAPGTNDFRVEFHPKNLPDGMYALRAQGTDVTGNVAGTEPYQVSFEVINASQITHFYPYPNPFSTKTRFVFTLTGADLPDQLKIQVMTVTGKVVREITQQELGPLRIGNNVTDFAWDGTDEYGDRLANGVYLYRVLARHNGQDIERRATAADRSFHREWGKLVILR